jgi:hypothetical protein
MVHRLMILIITSLWYINLGNTHLQNTIEARYSEMFINRNNLILYLVF